MAVSTRHARAVPSVFAQDDVDQLVDVSDINIAIATKMAKVFDVQVYHFIYTDLENFDGVYRPFKPLFEEIKIATEEERQLIINYRNLDDDHKERLAEIIKFYLNEQN